jgi:hypothetical protein
MSIQFSTVARNAMLDGLQYGAANGQTTGIGGSAKLFLYTGTIPVSTSAGNSSAAVWENDLPNFWAANAVAGALSITTLPIQTTCTGSGTITNFRIFDSAASICHLQGNVNTTNADMTIDNAVVTLGQTVQVITFTLTAPGA